MKKIILTIIIIITILAILQKEKINNDYNKTITLINNIKLDNSSWSHLKSINEDIIAWLILDNTSIDYPVVKGDNNQEYLRHNYYKNYSLSGSIFLDYRNNSQFNDNISIIYGHNMNNNTMFSELSNYLDEYYFNTHLKGKLLTPSKSYNIDVLGVIKTSAYNKEVYNLNMNPALYIKNLKGSFYYYREMPLNNILILSTCTNINISERVVLITNISPNEWFLLQKSFLYCIIL